MSDATKAQLYESKEGVALELLKFIVGQNAAYKSEDEILATYVKCLRTIRSN